MSVTCSPIWRSLVEVSSSITCPVVVWTFTRLVSVSTATTVARTSPLPCAEVPLAPGRPRLTGLDVDQRGCGDVHLDDLAILVRDVPGVWDTFDMHHGGAQWLPKDAGRDQHDDGKYDPSRRSVPGPDWRCIAFLLSVTRTPPGRPKGRRAATIGAWGKESSSNRACHAGKHYTPDQGRIRDTLPCSSNKGALSGVHHFATHSGTPSWPPVATMVLPVASQAAQAGLRCIVVQEAFDSR